MCGIVGILGFEDSGFRVTEPLVTRMRDTMAHRGPDGGSTWIDRTGRIGLGHRRLCIIDLGIMKASAARPLSKADVGVTMKRMSKECRIRTIRPCGASNFSLAARLSRGPLPIPVTPSDAEAA